MLLPSGNAQKHISICKHWLPHAGLYIVTLTRIFHTDCHDVNPWCQCLPINVTNFHVFRGSVFLQFLHVLWFPTCVWNEFFFTLDDVSLKSFLFDVARQNGDGLRLKGETPLCKCKFSFVDFCPLKCIRYNWGAFYSFWFKNRCSIQLGCFYSFWFKSM